MELNAPFFRSSSFSLAFSLAAPCAARYLRLRRAADGIYARKSFRRGRQAGAALVSKSSGPCDSAHVWLGVSFALVGVGGEEIDRIRVRISRRGARFDRIHVRFDRIGVRFDRVCPWILGDRRGLAGLGSAITAFFATPFLIAVLQGIAVSGIIRLSFPENFGRRDCVSCIFKLGRTAMVKCRKRFMRQSAVYLHSQGDLQ